MRRFKKLAAEEGTQVITVSGYGYPAYGSSWNRGAELRAARMR